MRHVTRKGAARRRFFLGLLGCSSSALGFCVARAMSETPSLARVAPKLEFMFHQNANN